MIEQFSGYPPPREWFAKLVDTPLGTSNPPATATSPGKPGQIEWDATNLYVCVALDTWVKTTLATF